jgi:hypothetical protein
MPSSPRMQPPPPMPPAPSMPPRSPFAVGMAGLAGAAVGAAAGALIGGFGWAATHPNPEGLEALAALVVALLAGAVMSYPGAVLGVWLAVRGREGARATVLWIAALYPLVLLGPALEVLGFRGPGGGAGLTVAIAIAFGAGALARTLALRRREEAAHGQDRSRGGGADAPPGAAQ